MKKIKTPEDNIKVTIPEEVVISKELIKVKFKNTYIGKLGNYYIGRIYELSSEQYKKLKNDCEVL